jgi:hypothetical protein
VLAECGAAEDKDGVPSAMISRKTGHNSHTMVSLVKSIRIEAMRIASLSEAELNLFLLIIMRRGRGRFLELRDGTHVSEKFKEDRLGPPRAYYAKSKRLRC